MYYRAGLSLFSVKACAVDSCTYQTHEACLREGGWLLIRRNNTQSQTSDAVTKKVVMEKFFFLPVFSYLSTLISQGGQNRVNCFFLKWLYNIVGYVLIF